MAKKKKEFIVTYRSMEHYEVLGWIEAEDIKEAKKKAKKKLDREAKYYNVPVAEIAEWGEESDEILFDI